MFEPNNHSKFQVTWREVSVDQLSRFAGYLKRHYSLGLVERVQKSDELGLNSLNFKVILKKDGLETAVLLRRHLKDSNEDAISLLNKVTIHLSAEKLPVPQFILSQNGSLFFKAEESFWTVSTFVWGNYYRGTESELKEVARQIAKLHLALMTLSTPSADKKTFQWSRDILVKMLQDERREDEYSLFLKGKEDLLLRVAGQIDSERERLDKLDLQLIHNDLHPHNVLFANGKLSGLLDFGNMTLGSRSRDVGMALHRFVRQFVVNKRESWEALLPEGIKIFMTEYSKTFPLSQQETRAVPFLIKDELLRKILSSLNKYYNQGSIKAVGGGQLKKYLSLLEEAEAIESYL